MQAVLIHGYGIFLETNLEYFNYLQKAFKYISENSVDVVIASGGFTDKNYPNISEADSIIDYLKKNLSKDDIKFVKEEEAFTTPQNLEFGADLLSKYKNSLEKLTI